MISFHIGAEADEDSAFHEKAGMSQVCFSVFSLFFL